MENHWTKKWKQFDEHEGISFHTTFPFAFSFYQMFPTISFTLSLFVALAMSVHLSHVPWTFFPLNQTQLKLKEGKDSVAEVRMSRVKPKWTVSHTTKLDWVTGIFPER